MLRPYPRSNGSEGNGIGNARGIPPCGVGRRHLFGCQGVGPAFRGRTARGSVTISATSLARVQRGGANPGPCARGSGAMSLWPRADWPVGRWLKLALVGSIAQPFWSVSRRWMGGAAFCALFLGPTCRHGAQLGLSSMRFHPTGGGPEDDEDGQKAWFTARIASLIG